MISSKGFVPELEPETRQCGVGTLIIRIGFRGILQFIVTWLTSEPLLKVKLVASIL